MVNEEELKRRIYDETASLITSQAIVNRLTTQEMHFLLHLLDWVVIKNQSRPFLEALHKWGAGPPDSQTDSQVKALLLEADLSNEHAIAVCAVHIEELLSANIDRVRTAKEESDHE